MMMVSIARSHGRSDTPTVCAAPSIVGPPPITILGPPGMEIIAITASGVLSKCGMTRRSPVAVAPVAGASGPRVDARAVRVFPSSGTLTMRMATTHGVMAPGCEPIRHAGHRLHYPIDVDANGILHAFACFDTDCNRGRDSHAIPNHCCLTDPKRHRVAHLNLDPH